MDSNQGSRPSVIRTLVLDPDEDQEPQPGGKVMVLSTGEKVHKKEIVDIMPPQHELDRDEPAPCNLVEGKSSQEESPQVSVSEEATGAVEEGEVKEGEKGGEEVSEGISGPLVKGNHMEAQQDPQQEAAAAIPGGSRSLHPGVRPMTVPQSPRFSRSHLRVLENLFQETHNPSSST
ncbi:hypothetical protein HispidOSU_025712, partial [Sigmodon hispidus]